MSGQKSNYQRLRAYVERINIPVIEKENLWQLLEGAISEGIYLRELRDEMERDIYAESEPQERINLKPRARLR